MQECNDCGFESTNKKSVIKINDKHYCHKDIVKLIDKLRGEIQNLEQQNLDYEIFFDDPDLDTIVRLLLKSGTMLDNLDNYYKIKEFLETLN